MKTRVFMSLAAIAILLTLAMPIPARADARTYFTGSETGCGALGVSREWPSGPNYHLRVDSQTCSEVGSIVEATGTIYLSDGVINLVGGGALATMTGKFRFETDEGGIWVGSFTWPANTMILKGVGRGQGLYEGLTIHMVLDQTTSNFWGYIESGG